MRARGDRLRGSGAEVGPDACLGERVRSGVGAVQLGPGDDDIALRRSCGALVAERTWIIVYEDVSDPEIDQLAIYLLRQAGEWKVWGTYRPALIL